MAPMALVVQHLEAEGPALVATLLQEAGVDLRTHRSDLDPEVPTNAEGLDALVVMGGPMSAGSDDGFPSRPAELDLLTDAVERGVPTLGVCLGAQLMAVATGGACVPGDELEVGWAPITMTAAADDDPLFRGLPPQLTVLHWHGETVHLPPGAELLASSAVYPNQAFRVGSNAWGLQFHLEAGLDEVTSFVEAFPGDASISPGGAVALLEATPMAISELAPHAAIVVSRFAQLALDHSAQPTDLPPGAG